MSSEVLRSWSNYRNTSSENCMFRRCFQRTRPMHVAIIPMLLACVFSVRINKIQR